MDSTHKSPSDRSRRSTSSENRHEHRASTSPERAGSSAKKVGNGLVALGSAAVVAVYTAGFLRTRPAAARLEAASQRRFPSPVQAMVSVSPGAMGNDAGAARTSAPTPSPSGQVSLALPTTPRLERDASSVASRPADSAAPPTAVATTSSKTSTIAAAPVSSALAPAAEPQPSTSASVTPSLPAPAAPPSLSGVPSGERTVADALASLPPAVTSGAHYKDGTYSGWGSCRHGDLEATVVVEGGRIVVARISMCLTRYSCSWIAPLPPQVLARQSQNVDYVSGATESAIAFYNALGEALGKAK